MTVSFEESEMRFGPYAESDIFCIEKSEVYKNIADQGVKSVEFLLFRNDNNIFWIEAKSSFPDPENKGSFDVFVETIAEKFQHSLSLFASAVMGKTEDSKNELPEHFKNFDYSVATFRLIVIIKNVTEPRIQCLHSISDALKQKLKPYLKIWKIDGNHVAAMTQAFAAAQGLQVSDKGTIQ